MMTSKKEILKVTLIGDGAVGKTSLRKSFMGEKFEAQYILTLGADFAVKTIEIGNTSLVLQIWDLAGQERFSEIRESYYHNTRGLMIVFDLTNHRSFENIPKWISEYSKIVGGDIPPLIILGNKYDLTEKDLRDVSPKEIEDYLQILTNWGTSNFSNFKVKYYETSALTGINVQEAFEKLGAMMLSQMKDMM